MPPEPDGQSPSWLSYALLFAVLLGVVLLQPLISQLAHGQLAVNLLFALLLLSGLWAVGRTPLTLGIGVAIAALAVLFRAVVFVKPLPGVFEIAAAAWFSGLFCLFAAIVFVGQVLREHEVGVDHLFGGGCAYVLLGLTWASWYVVVEALSPGAFSGQDEGPLQLADFTYFSFATLTTLGYGDIAPQAPFARSMAVLEGVVGQLYVAILIARLVGVHTAHSIEQRRRP